MRVLTSGLLAAAVVAVAVGCGGSSSRSASGFVTYREPSQGWSANVPLGWVAVAPGPEFMRNDPLTDPTRLYLETYRNSAPVPALRTFSTARGIVVTAGRGARLGDALSWQRYSGRVTGKPAITAELAVAKVGVNSVVAALLAARADRTRLVQETLLPVIDSFTPGSPQTQRSVLADAAPTPAEWPTTGWRTASPASQGIDGKQLDAMVTEIRTAKLPIDSVTVIRHGYVVLDQRFGAFAAGTLGEPYASGRRHELQSATKSVTSMLLGIALQERASSGVTAKTRVMRIAAAVHYVPAHIDARKRAITLEDLLTMQSGLAWKESGYAYETGSGNDVMAMLETKDWTGYAIDRPMASTPGTTFVYNTGGAHLVSGATAILTGRGGTALAAKRLFAPLGIHDAKWQLGPEGIVAGGFGLQLQPRDLAKLGFLYLHHGRWNGRQIVPAAWVESSTTDHVSDPLYEYGYLWWLDRADGYAYMAGLYGQLAAVDPAKDIVAVITAHIPATMDGSTVTRWLLEHYVLPACD